MDILRIKPVESQWLKLLGHMVTKWLRLNTTFYGRLLGGVSSKHYPGVLQSVH